MLPLYRSLAELFEKGGSWGAANPSLVFDKYIANWPAQSRNAIMEAAGKHFNSAAGRQHPDPGLLRAHAARRAAQVRALGGQVVRASTEWRFVSDVGAASPLENGFVWHHTLGVPFLPGSSVKGMMRAWADPKHGWGGCTEPERVSQLFGGDGAGSVLVFDALPEEPPKLEVDVLNVHYQPYYSKAQRYPTDYMSPVPVKFLVVAAGQPFQFAVAPRAGAPTGTADVDEAVRLLTEALQMIGAGAKTAAGYGRFAPAAQEAEPKPPQPETAAAPTEPPAVTALRQRIDATRGDHVSGQVAGWTDRIEQVVEPDYRAELARLAYQKACPDERSKRKAVEKPWYPKLLRLMNEGEDAGPGG